MNDTFPLRFKDSKKKKNKKKEKEKKGSKPVYIGKWICVVNDAVQCVVYFYVVHILLAPRL